MAIPLEGMRKCSLCDWLAPSTPRGSYTQLHEHFWSAHEWSEAGVDTKLNLISDEDNAYEIEEQWNLESGEKTDYYWWTPDTPDEDYDENLGEPGT